jgi:anion-transporting  ArsA/GET3 family ATPase
VTRPLDLDRVLRDAQIVVCCGAGGVGKTTTAAALALRAAEAGRHVVVLTIDPARRLAQSLGLTELDNTPRPVVGLTGEGSLEAMMLDMKSTFDELVVEHAAPEKAKAILENRFYQALSSSFAGTQEYMAMEKLAQLRASGDYDLIVVDTPPTRSALDFLDAPQRLTQFLDGRMTRILLAPAKAGGKAGAKSVAKVIGTGLSVFTSVLTRIIGADVLKDLSAFIGALETMFGGFRERAQATYDLLKDEGTSFVVVAAPQADALREAAYFVERLAHDRMPLAGLVVNRVHVPAATLTAGRAASAAERLDDAGEHATAVALLRLHACGSPSTRRTCRSGSPGRTRRCRSSGSAPSPGTCTTSSACVRSARR